MPVIVARRGFCLLLGGSAALLGLAVGCGGGGGRSFVSTSGTPVAAPTNVTGKSDTEGLGAGAALQSPGQSGASGPSPTPTPTVTPVPGK